MVTTTETEARPQERVVQARPQRRDGRARLGIAVGLLVVLAVGTYLAFAVSGVRPSPSTGASGQAYRSTDYVLLSETPLMWLFLAAPLLGILFGAIRGKRSKSLIENGEMVWHTATGTFLEHWTVALSGLMLIGTVVLLGTLNLPRLLTAPQQEAVVINLHLVALVVLFFGAFYHVTNHLLAGDFYRFLPDAQDFKDAILYFSTKIGLAKYPHGKYLASGKFAYAVAGVLISVIIVTGAIIILGQIVNSLPGGLLQPANFLHDLAILLLLAFLAVHLIFVGPTALRSLGGVRLEAGETAFRIPDSSGYLVVDDKMCGQCKVCMSACSLFHEGEVNLALSRIQIIADPMNVKFSIEQCRQCVDAPCVAACRFCANAVSPDILNARVIDGKKCRGCRRCQEACPYTFPRLQFSTRDQRMRKCDLCDGDPQCAKLCPNGAIKFLKNEGVPSQQGDSGYKVSLRRDHPWAKLKWDN